MTNEFIATPESKHIAGFIYNPQYSILRVEFRRGNHQYDYYGVPSEVVDSLHKALSKSSYFSVNIKNKYRVVRVK